ncbi:hypothetical protein RRG08_000243 [Elysia crispata]|uniref:Uncharacterized protein n=1 Tax=Elysia crispata TaxID=231223 RepID=A0AAE1AX70_9GAST|nr:hypothetical protein RRG08_000243 [Elysia crispata]
MNNGRCWAKHGVSRKRCCQGGLFDLVTSNELGRQNRFSGFREVDQGIAGLIKLAEDQRSDLFDGDLDTMGKKWRP